MDISSRRIFLSSVAAIFVGACYGTLGDTDLWNRAMCFLSKARHGANQGDESIDGLCFYDLSTDAKFLYPLVGPTKT